jgi:dTDP-4-dehydrorhamnose 3,5-epimerase
MTVQDGERRAAGPEPVTISAAEAARADRAHPDGPDLAMAGNIAGVRIERLVQHDDHRGSLMPFLNFGSPFWSEPIVYGYRYTVRPGRIKGWGMHRRQTDRYFVESGNLRVVLFDGRDDSPDKGHFCQFFFSSSSPGLLLIPPGVWHASQNWGRTLVRVANFPTVRYDAKDPDKYRIDPHSGAIPFDWSLRDG